MKNNAPQFDLPLDVPTEQPKTSIAKNFYSAYCSGRKAARQGMRKMPPYKNHTDWRRSFRHYWNEGFMDQETGKPERYQARVTRKSA